MLLLLAPLAAFSACTDAATRVANDLESGAKHLRSSRAMTATVDHAPTAAPEGCAGAYTLQLSRASSLLIWCQDSIGAPSHGTYTTTYHLNFVTVPQTFIIHKDSGQHALIGLAMDGNAVAVTGLR